MTRVAFQAACRAAAVTLLFDYGAAAGLKLQVYPGRPRSVTPPCAFVDRMTETIDPDNFLQRSPRVEVLVLHGLFDSADAASQKDDFVDGFVDWVADRFHAAGANTLIAPVAVEDEPNFVTDWMREEDQRTYYATRITLEGFASG